MEFYFYFLSRSVSISNQLGSVYHRNGRVARRRTRTIVAAPTESVGHSSVRIVRKRRCKLARTRQSATTAASIVLFFQTRTPQSKRNYGQFIIAVARDESWLRATRTRTKRGKRAEGETENDERHGSCFPDENEITSVTLAMGTRRPSKLFLARVVSRPLVLPFSLISIVP